MYLDQGLNYRLVIDNRWHYSLLFFYQISICLYYSFIEYRFFSAFSLSISNRELDQESAKESAVFGKT